MNSKQPFQPFGILRKAMSVVMLLILLTGCSLPGAPAATATPLPPQNTATALPPQNTATPLPPTQTAAPAVSPTAGPTVTPAVLNIVFSPGASMAEVEGTIQPNQVQTYTVNAGQDQPMLLALNSINGDATLGVFEPDGNKLLDPEKKWAFWEWILPKTELYTIQVIGGASPQPYALSIELAQIVNFPAGASSVTLNGSTPNGFVFAYALSCKANQVMTISLNVPNTTAYFDVLGIASGTLLSPMDQSSKWSGTLPSTQTYIIEVIPANGQVVDYTLTVSVK
jgi:hypothetical protein